MGKVAGQFEKLPLETIQAALSHVPASDREVWVRMAMAVKSELGDAGFDIWNNWSATDQSYNAADAKTVWRSVKESGSTTIASLIKLAMDNGFDFSQQTRRISDAELAERQRARQAELDAEKRRQDARHKRAATEAARQYGEATSNPDAIAAHAYIGRKEIPIDCAGAVRIGTYARHSGSDTITVPNSLLVPIYGPDRSIMSVQAIFPDASNPLGRDRDYLPGGQKTGGYFPIGKATPAAPAVLICEGYATGVALHRATGHPVLVAFDAGNLANVAKFARGKMPDTTLVICADNDRHGERGNTGIRMASRAALESAGIMAVPEFDGPDGTDFDDLAKAQGLDAVAACIQAAISPPTQLAAANDNAQGTDIDQTDRFDMGAVNWYAPLPDTNSDGKKPLSTIENLEEICRRLGVIIRYNVISKEIELLIPREGFSVDNHANASLAWLISVCARFRMPTGQIGDFLCYLGDRNQYNPVANWIRSKPWDGVSRLADLYATIEVEGEADGDITATKLKSTLIRRWMLSAVAGAFKPDGVSAHGVLVLQGDQYLGKTKWFKSLVPAELGVIRDGLSLRPDDRDSVFQAVSHWMVELGELDATFRKADIAALKAFLTRDKDILRRAYARLESKFARRTVFFASVNPRQFLHDPTGNRRYWTLPCVAINHDHSVDMQQVWAEVYETAYLAGETWYLQPDEMALLNTHNSGFEVLDPIRERAQTRFAWDYSEATWRWMTATDIMAELGFDKPSRTDVTQCGQLMRELNGRKAKRSNGKNLLLVPPLKHERTI